MMEGAQNTRKTVVMCVRYRFSKIELSGKVSSLEMPKFQAASPDSTNESWNTRLKEACMVVEIIVAVITCITSIINAIFAALSYLKGKDKE